MTDLPTFPATPFDERGARAVTIELSFYGTAPSPVAWRDIVERLGYAVAGIGDAWNATFVALPAAFEPMMLLYLTGEVRPVWTDPSRTHWRMKVETIPDLSPPESIQELSRKVGGFPGVLERLAERWPADLTPEVETKLLFQLDRTRWRSPFGSAHRRRLQDVKGERAVAKLDSEVFTWRIEPPGVITEVMDLGTSADDLIPSVEGKLSILSVEGKLSATIGVDLFETVEAKTWHRLATFLGSPARRGASPNRRRKRTG